MILTDLAEYYDELAKKGEIPLMGWSRENVSFGIALDKQGNVTGIISKKIPNEKGKMVVGTMDVPEHPKKSSGICPCFLCDASKYLLGIDPVTYKDESEQKKKQKRAVDCFEASKELHTTILSPIRKTSAAAESILSFYEKWDIEAGYKKYADYFPDFQKNGFLIFTDETGKPFSEYPEIQDIWEKYRIEQGDKEEPVLCLDTGSSEIPAKIHPAIKGIKNAQSSGATLVTFNCQSFISYGFSDDAQGLNSPVSKTTAFKYAATLNKLIKERKNIVYIGKTALIFWAEHADHTMESIFLRNFDNNNEITEDDLRSVYIHLIRDGCCTVNGDEIHYDNKFFVCGIEPNAARLSLRFFWKGKFGDIVRNVTEHHKRLTIIQPYEGHAILPTWKIVNETCIVKEDDNGKKSTLNSPAQSLSDALTKAILFDTRYPAELFSGMIERIRAEHRMGFSDWEKAAIIKAYLMKNTNEKEVTTVTLNEETNEPAYVLGRLFAVLEKLQEDSAKPTKLSATIKDRYFGSAAATPGIVFPQLVRLAQNHERKLDDGTKIYYDKQITDLMGRLNGYPTHLSLQEQGKFYLGYYHQRQKLFTGSKKAEKKEDVVNE